MVRRCPGRRGQGAAIAPATDWSQRSAAFAVVPASRDRGLSLPGDRRSQRSAASTIVPAGGDRGPPLPRGLTGLRGPPHSPLSRPAGTGGSRSPRGSRDVRRVRRYPRSRGHGVGASPGGRLSLPRVNITFPPALEWIPCYIRQQRFSGNWSAESRSEEMSHKFGPNSRPEFSNMLLNITAVTEQEDVKKGPPRYSHAQPLRLPYSRRNFQPLTGKIIVPQRDVTLVVLDR